MKHDATRDRRVVVIGAGIGGLAAALDLAVAGLDVEVFERAATPGGKMREVVVDGRPVDAGPTVFTMRGVFDALLERAGTRLDDQLTLRPLHTLARHAWSDSERLDLFASTERSVDEIARFAGSAEALRFREFCAMARRTFELLDRPFMRSQRPSAAALVRETGIASVSTWLKLWPFRSLWSALGGYFHDPRLRQLFGRYATYCGSSPFAAPATLMLIAHVEATGVWTIDGGMHGLARTLASLATARGARIRYGHGVRELLVTGSGVEGIVLENGECIRADAVVSNSDALGLAAGALGSAAIAAVPAPARHGRSLSAMTWSLVAPTRGFPLQRHTVFFSADYAAEFEALFARRRLPGAPTVYVCAQDRDAMGELELAGAERLLCLVNAPATGDSGFASEEDVVACEHEAFDLMRRCGLEVAREPARTLVTTPGDFERLFPGTGGALYGAAGHGHRAAFERPGARSALPGLYLCGGSTHPGPGVPMAALSGCLAAEQVMADFDSTSRSRLMGMRGGTSTR